MSDDIVDLNAERNRRAKPGPECIRRDNYGREIFCFLASYTCADGKSYSTEIWAYDQAEAERRIEGMKQSLVYDGQLFDRIPL
jgi:hypothetical protein